ncbi:MAG: type IV secretion system DNA-binding domain-containing protein [Candidatus Dojkabacteria bacterium]|nr:type IV secretion system DNA-binding domain-containing protein [Candidatus Dojkabacteria bacterium]
MVGVILILLIFSLGFLAFIFILKSKFDKEEKEEVFESMRNPVIMQVLVPRENDKTPLAAEQMFASLHGLLGDSKICSDAISFEIVSTGENGIRFFVVSPKQLAKFVEGQVYAQYPNADIKYVQDYTLENVGNGSFITTGEVEFVKDYIFPIKTFRDFEVDPLAAITGAVSDLKLGESAWIQLIVRPVANYWQEESKKYITAVKDGVDLNENFGKKLAKLFDAVGKTLTTSSEDGGPVKKEVVKLAPGQEEELARIEEKMLKVGFKFVIRIVTKAESKERSEQILRDSVASFKQFTTAHLNSFSYSPEGKEAKEIYMDYLSRILGEDVVDIMNIEEIASVYHMPNISVETPNIAWSRSKKLEPPMNLPTENDYGVSVFADTDYREHRINFGLKPEDRRRHFYLLGKTGVGKSTLFKNMFIADILRGEGACFVDPHGEAVEELLDFIPPERIDDVVYFDPTDINHPVGFNLLELEDKSQRDLIADGVVEVFKKQFGDSWGPRLQYILTNAVATLLEAQNTTLLAVIRILTDNNYRKFILKQVNDPILLKFWEEEFAQMSSNTRLVTEAVAPIQNKVGRFISSAVIRNIIGQVKSTINLREIMDSRKILLVNLAQGKLGEETASLLGGMVITRLQSTAMERTDQPFDERKDFYLFVDEFQNFATDSFAKILSEARKYKLDLTMTNQYIDQLPLTVRQAIFGNVGTLGSFVVSQSDAAILEKEFAPDVSADDLVSLDSHAMYIKLCIDGMTSVPFSAKSLPPRYTPYGLKDRVIEASREKYSVDRMIIEDKIMRWSQQKYSDKGNRSVMRSNQDKKDDSEKEEKKSDKEK